MLNDRGVLTDPLGYDYAKCLIEQRLLFNRCVCVWCLVQIVWVCSRKNVCVVGMTQCRI